MLKIVFCIIKVIVRVYSLERERNVIERVIIGFKRRYLYKCNYFVNVYKINIYDIGCYYLL